LSESQERMLIVAREGREKQVVDIFKKWDLDAVVIGKVVEGHNFRVFHNGELKADIPVAALTDDAPKYERPMAEEKQPTERVSRNGDWIASSTCPQIGPPEAIKILLASPNICSKHWVYEQYDTMVRTNTAVLPGADAAVIRVKETRRAIAMCLDGNGRYVAVDAKRGAMLTIAEAARNVVCVGARPIAVTNCLNFASPERPEVMRSFSDVIDGIKEACEAFETPVVSGNVSFYNETEGKRILPTPVIGMIGLIEDTRKIITQGFKGKGDIVALLGVTKNDLSVSQYAQSVLGLSTDEIIASGSVPELDIKLEKQVQETVLRLADGHLLKSAHDCSDGGLAVALAECCFSSLGRGAIGADIDIKSNGLLVDALLFAETPSRIVISFAASDLDKVRDIVGNCPFAEIGKVGGEKINISVDHASVVSAPVLELERMWCSSLEEQLYLSNTIAG